MNWGSRPTSGRTREFAAASLRTTRKASQSCVYRARSTNRMLSAKGHPPRTRSGRQLADSMCCSAVELMVGAQC